MLVFITGNHVLSFMETPTLLLGQWRLNLRRMNNGHNKQTRSNYKV